MVLRAQEINSVYPMMMLCQGGNENQICAVNKPLLSARSLDGAKLTFVFTLLFG